MEFKDTFYFHIDNNPLKKRHLFVIASKPELTCDSTVICVNFTTSKNDQTCKVQVGEHPYITETCYVNYQDSFEITISEIVKKINSGTFYQNDKCQKISDELYEKIVNGANQTKKIRLSHKKYFKL